MPWFYTRSRYCHCQYCTASIAIKAGREETVYCAIVWAMKGWGGVPKQGGVFANKSIDSWTKVSNKTISCEGQAITCCSLLMAARCSRAARDIVGYSTRLVHTHTQTHTHIYICICVNVYTHTYTNPHPHPHPHLSLATMFVATPAAAR